LDLISWRIEVTYSFVDICSKKRNTSP